MKTNSAASRPSRSGRRSAGRAQQDHVLDPYEAQQKLSEPAACPECGASYHHGRWQWGPRPADAHDELCPACRRIKDGFPAGILSLQGDFARQHAHELISLARNQEAAEIGEHPLNRIANIEQTDTALVITTTDIHLPRRIAEAVKRAYRGTLDLHFDKAGYFVRASWHPPS